MPTSYRSKHKWELKTELCHFIVWTEVAVHIEQIWFDAQLLMCAIRLQTKDSNIARTCGQVLLKTSWFRFGTSY